MGDVRLAPLPVRSDRFFSLEYPFGDAHPLNNQRRTPLKVVRVVI
jgi:hypothetical protein